VRKQFASSMSTKFRQLPDESEDIEMDSDQRSLLHLLNAVNKSG